MGHRQVTTRGLAAVAGAVLVGLFWTTAAYADDPLAPIVSAIQRDRKKACGDILYDKQLEAVAQAYARSPSAPLPPPGYQRVKYFKGTGDPESRAIDSAYGGGAGQVIADCTVKSYGVGFVRNGERDVVTVAFGITGAAPASPPKSTASHASAMPGGPKPRNPPIQNGTVSGSGGGGEGGPKNQCEVAGDRCPRDMKLAVDESTGVCTCSR